MAGDLDFTCLGMYFGLGQFSGKTDDYSSILKNACVEKYANCEKTFNLCFLCVHTRESRSLDVGKVELCDTETWKSRAFFKNSVKK